MNKLEVFCNRLGKIGIDIKLEGNYPWVYIYSINGKRVIEQFHGNHGWTIAFLPIRPNQEIEFTDISELFKLIRKYVKNMV